MATLFNKTKSAELISDLKIADNLFSRMKGLLGTNELSENQAMWIHRCNSIHTYFMKYPIDCVFLTRDLRVLSIVESVGPWKMVWPQWGADSVVEMRSGNAKKLKLNIGDELHVGN
ncbi:MAG: hypothetical protein BroJett040_04050 [Oligoflexia bacterium]|nr:MAG: hypothetical protein BroJett040_04050 [Oligoflexia bacterium]